MIEILSKLLDVCSKLADGAFWLGLLIILLFLFGILALTAFVAGLALFL